MKTMTKKEQATEEVRLWLVEQVGIPQAVVDAMGEGDLAHADPESIKGGISRDAVATLIRNEYLGVSAIDSVEQVNALTQVAALELLDNPVELQWGEIRKR